MDHLSPCLAVFCEPQQLSQCAVRCLQYVINPTSCQSTSWPASLDTSLNLYSTFIIYSAIRLCSRKCLMNSVCFQCSDQELLDVAEENVVNDTRDLQSSDESRAANTDDITVLEDLSTVSDAAAAVTDMEERLASDGHLGELLSCAECGSSGV